MRRSATWTSLRELRPSLGNLSKSLWLRSMSTPTVAMPALARIVEVWSDRPSVSMGAVSLSLIGCSRARATRYA